MVEDLHKGNLDGDLEKGDEDYRNEMGVDGRFLLRNRRRQEYYNVGHGNVKKYAYQHGNIHIQTSEQEKNDGKRTRFAYPRHYHDAVQLKTRPVYI